MIDVPENIEMTRDGYTPHRFMHKFINDDVWTKLREEWPEASLFKEEGNTKARRHNQRPHLRMFACYCYWPQEGTYFDKYKIHRYQLSKTWDSFIDWLVSDKDYLDFIRDSLEITGDFKMRFDWHIAKGGQDVSPHTDSPAKYGSHLFYFNPEGWNDDCGGKTVFYKDKQIENLNPEFSDFKNNIVYPNTGNTSLLFKNEENGWHGVTPVNTELTRNIFNVVVLKNDN